MNRSKLVKNLAVSLFCATGMLAGTAAFAAPVGTTCSVVDVKKASVANATTDDATLNSAWSTACVFSNVNPAGSGSDGDTSGFGSAFDAYTTDPSASWLTLGKIETKNGTVSSNGLTLKLAKNGTWTVTNTTGSALTLDLVLDIHAGNASTAFLFDDQTIGGNATLSGTWAIQWNNNGGNIPGYSNAVFFARDLGTGGSGGGEGGNVPEPGSLALMGLGMLGVVALRKRNKA